MGSTGVESGSNLRQRVKQSNTSSGPPDEPPLQIATLTPPLGQFIISTVLSVAGLVAAVAFGVFAILSVRLSQDANAQTFAQNQLALLGLCVGDNDYSGSAECSRVVVAARNIIPSVASQLSIPIASGSRTATTTRSSSTRTASPSSTSGSVNSSSPPPVLVITSVSTSGTLAQTFLSTVSSTSSNIGAGGVASSTASEATSSVTTSVSSSTSLEASASFSPRPTGISTGASSSDGGSHPSTGTIVGASVGSIVVLILILSTIVWWTVRRGQKAITAEQQYEDEKQKPPSFMTRLGVRFRSLFIDSTVGFRSAQ